MSSSDSELGESDIELQEAFAAGKLKPGLNIPVQQKIHINNTKGLQQKLREFKVQLPWIETLECLSKQAPMAPEMAAQLHVQEQKRENQMQNNRKLPQIALSDDPVLNDFKREMMFHRQAQATIMEAVPKLKQMGIAIKRPEDYFAEMAKTDDHMQKIRASLMQKEQAQKRSEKVKQLRMQRKEGKAIQTQARQQRQQEKTEMLNQVKKVRKGLSKDMSFLDGTNGTTHKSKVLTRKSLERRKRHDKKFGFGGKKRGSKLNTKDSAAEINEYRRPSKKVGGGGGGKSKTKNRPGKSRRIKNRTSGKR